MRHKRLYPILAVVIVFAGCDVSDVVTEDRATDESAEVARETERVLSEVDALALGFDRETTGADKFGRVVRVPAGSRDALAAALERAKQGGVVVLGSGPHYESGTVAVTKTVAILGERGAKLIVDTQHTPASPTFDPALHVMDASRVAIWGVEILPLNHVGGTAILAERAPHLTIGRTTVRDMQSGIILDRTNHATIVYNDIALSTADEVAAARGNGVTIINGTHARIVGNKTSNAFVGIFAGDEDGRVIANETFGNLIGVVFCKVPYGFVPAPSGNFLYADISATRWIAGHNNSHHNAWGYLLIDGTSENLLTRTNKASNNSAYDIELTGDTNRFGFLAPASFVNRVFIGDRDIVVKDCGVDNRVRGGVMVDTSTDPCF